MPKKDRKTKRIFTLSSTKNRKLAELERRIAAGLEIDVINDSIFKIYAAFAAMSETIPPKVESLLQKCRQPARLLNIEKKKKRLLFLKAGPNAHLNDPSFLKPLRDLVKSFIPLIEEYPTLSGHIHGIQKVYSDFIQQWNSVDIAHRKKMLIPKPELCCEGGGSYYLPLESSLQILSRNEFGDRRKQNQLGNRPVFAGNNGVHYKAQPERDFIRPGNEKLASETYNFYDPQLAAPSLLLKLTIPKKVVVENQQVTPINKQSYVAFQQALLQYPDVETLLQQRPDIAKNLVISYAPVSECVQASLTINGILFLEILQLKQTLSTLSNRVSQERVCQLVDSVIQEAKQQMAQPAIEGLSLDSVKREFDNFFRTLSDEQKPLDCKQADFERTFAKHREDGAKKLYDTLQLLKKFPDLMPGLRLIDLLQLPKQLNHLATLWPTLATEQRLTRLSQFYQYWNPTNAQHQFVANLILFPTDWKSDNIMVNWTMDSEGNLQEWNIVGIDNDGVFPEQAVKVKQFGRNGASIYHSIEVKCIPFCIDELQHQELLASTRHLLVKQTPAVALITRIKAVYEQNFRYERMKRTGALNEEDLIERDALEESQHLRKLDIPVTLTLPAVLALYNRLQRLYEAGKSEEPLTLADLFTRIDPIVAGAYQLAIQSTNNEPLDAFEKVTKPSLEDAFGDNLDQNGLRAQLQALPNSNAEQPFTINQDFSPEELVIALIQHFAQQNPVNPDQLPPVFELLSAVATIFSDVQLDLKMPEHILNQWLLLAMQKGDAVNTKLISFLIEQGANPSTLDSEIKDRIWEIVKDDFDRELIFGKPANSEPPSSQSSPPQHHAQNIRRITAENDRATSNQLSSENWFFGLIFGILLGGIAGLIIHNPIACLLDAWETRSWREWSIANILRAYFFAPLINPIAGTLYGIQYGFNFGKGQGFTRLLDIPDHLITPFQPNLIDASAIIIAEIAIITLLATFVTPVTLPLFLSIAGATIFVNGIFYECAEFFYGKNKSPGEEHKVRVDIQGRHIDFEPEASQRSNNLRVRKPGELLVIKNSMRTKNTSHHDALYTGSWKSWFQLPRTPVTAQEGQSNASPHP